MAETVMTQMNTRIGSNLKVRGDAVLAQAGYTPSAAVRALWRFVAAHEDSPEKVADLLRSIEKTPDEEKVRRAKVEAFHDAIRKADAFRGEHANASAQEFELLPYEDLRAMYLMERLEEKDAHAVRSV